MYYIFNDYKKLNITNYYASSDSYIVRKDVVSESENILVTYDNFELIYLKDYLKALSSSKIYILNLINFYKELLSSIDILTKNHIVHNKICFDTILIHDLKPLINDFSVSIDVSKPDICEYIKHFIMEYCPEYINWTPEFHLLAYLITNKLDSLSRLNLETIMKEIIENNYILKNFGNEIVSSYREEGLTYFKKYINLGYKEIVFDILQYHWSWDNYALSIMYLKILIDFHKKMKTKYNKENKFILFFMKLLVNNIHLNPLKRLSINITSNKFEHLLDNLNRNDYLDLLNFFPYA